MYLSNSEPNLVDERTRNKRTAILSRLYGMDFNLIPMNGKKPCVEWKPFQTRQVTPEEIKEWMRGRFPTKDGRNSWKPDIPNFAVLTGAAPWSDDNPGIVVLDADDALAEEQVQRYCPPTPMVQTTGSGNKQFVYRRPSSEVAPYIGNRQKRQIDGEQYNLDVRGDGGYIMAPGSIHPRTEKLYQEKTPWTMDLLMQCPVYDPAWLPCEQSSKTQKSRTSASVPRQIGGDGHEEVVAHVDMPMSAREQMALRYLKSVPGTQQGTGADGRCSALTMKLLYGFALPVDVVQKMLVQWGQQEDQLDDAGGWYPWTEIDIARKIDWCLEQEYRGEVGDRLAQPRDLGDFESKVDAIVGTFEVGSTIDAKDHLDIAKRFFDSCFTAAGKGTLIHHQSNWHHWTGNRYEVVAEDDIKARLWKWLAKCKCWKQDKVVAFQPSRSIVSGVIDALKAVSNHSSGVEAPCWITTGPADVIAFDNGLLDVEELLSSGKQDVLSHTPNWFSPNCLPHKFDPKATCPRWLEFLNQVFDGDQERIQTLQQWFGYNLTTDNRQHKLALLIGPPRSGKGTTMAVMSAMLGRYNVANTSLAALGGRFGLEPLIGKQAALIDEGHLGKFSDTSQILERLKAISGGSEQTVDRKGIAALSSVALKVRFTLAVNELPRLSDSSAAMRSRLLLIPFFNTYEGREDFGLLDRLLTEIPGITNWALAGLRKLREAGRFQNPAVGEKILRDFVYLSSPVKAFLDECCEVDCQAGVCRKDLQLAWQFWCEENGHMPGSKADFGRKLRAVVPRIDDERRRINGGREWWYVGVTLTPEARTVIANRRSGA